MHNDTIFALSTIFGKSGVAIIRISGIKAKETIIHFDIRKEITPRTLNLVTLYDSERFPIDNSLLVWFKGPNSFTGEDVIEIHTHGSKAVINIILQELGKIFRIAKPGEFSKRAFENGKLNLTEAEGLSDLIEAETKMQARQALRQMSGKLANLYDKWRSDLIGIIAELEAYIDFPDEDIPNNVIVTVNDKVNETLKAMKEHLQDNKRGEKLRNGFHISIIGAPNVGKSTLFNHLIKQDMAIVSDIAGTTRDTLEARIDLDGYPITIFDTAGIQNTLDPVEIEGILRAKERRKHSDLTLALFAFKDLPTLDVNIKSLIDSNTICIASKADYLPENVDIFVEDKKLLPISVHNNTGLRTIVKMIKGKVTSQLTLSEAPVITRERHRQAISMASKYLEKYCINNDLILAAEDLRMTAKTLGEITGDIKIDDVLDQLFSKFCIGK